MYFTTHIPSGHIFHNRPCTTRSTMAIAWDQVIIENTLLAAIIVGSIYLGGLETRRIVVKREKQRKAPLSL